MTSNIKQLTAKKGFTWTGSTFLLLGIICIALNLRAPLTAVGPIIGNVRETTGLSGSLAGLLTTLPLIAFALVSPLAPRISRRLGMEFTLFISMIVLAAGIIIRSLPSVPALFIGTTLLGMAIAVGNVLLPSLIKRDYPLKVGLMTGIYSVVMNLGAAMASGISIPLAEGWGFGWRGMLACWSLLAVATAAVWLPQLRSRGRASGRTISSQSRQPSPSSLWRSKLAWQITLFMGLQSFLFYVNISWLPEILHDRGFSLEASGWLLFLLQIVSLPASLLVPIIAGKQRSQRSLVVMTAAFLLFGYVGLLWGSSSLAPLWIMLIGVAGGSGFSLAVMFFGLRTSSAAQSAEMSGMAQSVGYLLAAIGPLLFGMLHDATHSWHVSIMMLIIVTVLLLLAGLKAGSDSRITA